MGETEKETGESKKNEERASKREKKKKLTSWFLKGRRVEVGRLVFLFGLISGVSKV